MVAYKDQVGVIIPGDTLANKQAVTISSAQGLPDHPFKGLTSLATYDISMGSIKEFKKPLTIEIAYDPSQIPAGLSADKGLVVGYWDANQQAWVSSPFAVDTTRNVLMVPSSHLTVWRVWAWAGWRSPLTPPRRTC